MPPPPSSSPPISGCCGGSTCPKRDTWPLHQLPSSRLCTYCLLSSHLSSFCIHCLEPPSPPLLTCLTCPSVSHVSCLETPPLSPNPFSFTCPTCISPKAAAFFLPRPRAGRGIDVRDARSLLAASRISAGIMREAADVARAEAERKVKEALVAKERAREVLLRAVEEEKEEKKKKRRRRRKKKGRSREADKWIRFQELKDSVIGSDAKNNGSGSLEENQG